MHRIVGVRPLARQQIGGRGKTMMQMASMGQSRAAGCRSAPCDAAGRAVWDLGLARPRVAGRTAMPEMAMARIRSRCWVGAERGAGDADDESHDVVDVQVGVGAARFLSSVEQRCRRSRSAPRRQARRPLTPGPAHRVVPAWWPCRSRSVVSKRPRPATVLLSRPAERRLGTASRPRRRRRPR